MTRNASDDTRTPAEDMRQQEQDEQTVDTDLPIGKPQTPAPEESQHLPDTGASTPNPPHRNPQDTMDEARDGFMDRYPPRGQDE